jgi:hypothetical protein
MALVKSLDRDNLGASAQYWRILHREDFFDPQMIEIALGGYVSEAARRAGCRPIGALLRYRLRLEDFPPGTNFHAITTAMLYTALRDKVAKAAALSPNRNPHRLPEIAGIGVDPCLAQAEDA